MNAVPDEKRVAPSPSGGDERRRQRLWYGLPVRPLRVLRPQRVRTHTPCFRDLERKGLIGAGTTLHGLRATYAAWLKRHGASDAEIAGALTDRSSRMGGHYSRHVEREANVVRAFKRVRDAK
jgi:integrase